VNLLVKAFGYLILFLVLFGGVKQWLFSYNFFQAKNLYQENQLPEALWKSKRALKYFPSHPEPHRLLAKIYLELLAQGRSNQKELLKKAEQELLRAISIEPNYPYYWAELGRVSELLEYLGEMPQKSPRSAFHRACLIDPNNPLFLNMFAKYLIRKKDFTSAQALLKKLLELSPRSTVELAKIWFNHNPEPEPLLEIFSSSPEILGELCEWIALHTKEKSLAQKYLKKAYLKNPDNQKLRLQYAKLLMNQGECEKTRQILEPLFSSPLEESALRIYSICLFRQKKWEEEEKVLLKLISLSPHSVEYRQNLAHLYLVTGQLQKAKEQLLWLCENAPSQKAQGKFYLELGKIFEKESNPQKALEFYKKYLKVYPGDKKIQQKVKKLMPQKEEIIYSPWRMKNEK